MFVEQLVDSEKNALMSLLVDISKADGNLADQEIEFLTSYSLEHGILLNLEEEKSLQDVCRYIKSYKGKIIVIQEIIKIAIVDGHYDDAERNGALAISEMLELPLNTFQKIESWVLEGERWYLKGLEMLGE